MADAIMTTRRHDGRAVDELRPLTLTCGWSKYAEGSCIVEAGNTRVFCTASIQDGVPGFLRGTGTGWVTGEYGMLPRACSERSAREAAQGKVGGRTSEIQRLIGRALRAVTNLEVFGERTLWVDCDVVQGDGGTRCASIVGGYVSLVQAFHRLRAQGGCEVIPVRGQVAAVSVGIVNHQPVLDLDYVEDKDALVDMNVVLTDDKRLVEVQGTAEGEPFDRGQLNELLDLAEKGIEQIMARQREVLGDLRAE